MPVLRFEEDQRLFERLTCAVGDLFATDLQKTNWGRSSNDK